MKTRILSYFPVQGIDNTFVNRKPNIAGEFSGFFPDYSYQVHVSVVVCKGGLNHDAAVDLIL